MPPRSVYFDAAVASDPPPLLTGLPLLDDRFGLGRRAGVRLVRVESPALDRVARAIFDRVRPWRETGGLGAAWYALPSLSIELADAHCRRAREMGDVVFLVVPMGRGPWFAGSQAVLHMVDVAIDVSGTPNRAVVAFRKNRYGYAGGVAVSCVDGELAELGLAEDDDE